MEGKFIVYQTTNLINNKIYIGIHQTPNINVFDGYLGDGIYVFCPYTYQHSKTLLQSDVKHYGIKNFRRNIISICDNEFKALQIEGMIVNQSFLSRDDVYNQLIGGKTFPNHLMLHCYSKNGIFLFSNNIKELSCITQTPMSIIFKSSLLGICVKDKYYFSFIKAESHSIAKTEFCKKRMVHKYNSNGNYIKSYESQELAEQENKYSNVGKSIRLKSVDKNGFMWSLEKLDHFNIPSQKDNFKIGKFDLDGNLLKEFKSKQEAIKTEGIEINKVLCGFNNNLNGFVYKYV